MKEETENGAPEKNCPNCQKLERVAIMVNEFLRGQGIVPPNIIIALEIDGCYKSLVPNCNIGIMEYTLTKIMMKMGPCLLAERRVLANPAAAEEIKKQVKEYLDGIGKTEPGKPLPGAEP